MANIGEIIYGLQIIEAHTGTLAYCVQAEHDQLFGGDVPNPNSADGYLLAKSAWEWDEDMEAWAIRV